MNSGCYDPGGSRPRPMRFACLFSICRYNRQLDPGVWVIGLASKALLRWKSGERWVGRRIWIEIGFGLSLVLECRWLWIIVVVVVCLYYHLPDWTSHLLFLFITLIFTTRLL